MSKLRRDAKGHHLWCRRKKNVSISDIVLIANISPKRLNTTKICKIRTLERSKTKFYPKNNKTNSEDSDNFMVIYVFKKIIDKNWVRDCVIQEEKILKNSFSDRDLP